jgi:endonuclease/exonuclease/phosphatase family metal-dependent hydrolase
MKKPIALLLPLLLVALTGTAQTVRVAAYNVENYLDQSTETRKEVKSEASKAKVREYILAMKPDVLVMPEMGQLSALKELQASLKKAGLDLPNLEIVPGWDTNIHVSVLSKYPITARNSHTNDTFLLSGKRFHVGRGFAEVEITVNPQYKFTVFGAHLKSRRPVAEADEAELRLEEAKILREKVNAKLAANPNANIIVCGDLNDTYDRPPIKAIIGRGKNALTDVRPTERNGDDQPNPTNPRWFPRDIAWTHYYGKEDSYSRIDFILVSSGMEKELVREETYIPTIANWGIGSDHRPLVATFTATDK